MATTNSDTEIALEYVLTNVLGERATRGPIVGIYRNVFHAAGITNIHDFC
jgi:hypothetical protein